MAQPQVSITGIPENKAALKKAGDVDVEQAGTDAARALIPEVERATRVNTGVLRSGWIAESGAFINAVPYAKFQEFGTRFIEATNAVTRAVESNEKKVTQAFEKKVVDAARKAGFDS